MEELFMKILNMSITATYVLMAVLVLRLLLKRAPKWISYSLWSLVLFRLVCPVSFSSAFSIFSRIGKATPANNSIQHISADIGMATIPQIDIGPASVNTVINNALPAASPVASANPMQILIFISACLWLTGIAAMLIYSVVSYIRLKHRLRDATLLSENIFETDRISSPFVCGLIKPKIYLPVGLGESERDYVLCHERTHIARKDHLTKPLAFLVLSVHWFNPFMWLAFILMSRDLEMSCDERVVSKLDAEGKAGYSSALVQLAMKRSILAGSPLAFGESGAKDRVKNVLNYKKPVFWVLTVAVVIVVTAGFTLLTNPTGGISKKEKTEIIPLSIEEIERYNKTLEPIITGNKGNSGVNPLSHFLTSYYDRPEDINLAEMLRYFPAEAVTAGAEFEALKAIDNWPFGADMTMERMPVPIRKIAAGVVNGVLQKHMGIGLDDVSGSERPIYSAEYDAFYNFTSDFAAGTFVCTSGETQGDIIRLYGKQATLTLKKFGDSFLFVSHKRVQSISSSDNAGDITDRRPMLMVNGEIYLDTGKQMPADFDGLTVLGSITTAVDQSEIPKQNGESNFGYEGAPYMYWDDGLIVKLNDGWFFFEKDMSDISTIQTPYGSINSVFNRVKITFTSGINGGKSADEFETTASKIVAYIYSTIRERQHTEKVVDLNKNYINEYTILLTNDTGGSSYSLYYDTLYNKAYIEGDGGLSETNTDFARYVESLLENTNIKIAIDDTDAAALFKKYGWTLDYQISAMNNKLNNITVLTGFNPNAYYFAYNNVLSTDIGLDMSGYSNSANIDVEIYRINESMPQEYYPIQNCRGIVVKENGKIIGAFISAGRHSAFNACSLKGNSFEKVAGQTLDEWLAERVQGDTTDEKLSKLEPEQIIKEYFTALNEKDAQTAKGCISKKTLLGNLTSNIPNDELFNEGYSLLLTDSDFSNLKSAKLIEAKLINEPDKNTKTFRITVDLQYDKVISIGSGEQPWDCIMIYESPQTGWKIEGFGH